MGKSEIQRREQDLFGQIEEIAKLPARSVSVLGLRLTDIEMPRREWERLGQLLGHIHRWGSWAIGDWLNFGETVYGQDAYDSTEGTRMERYDVAKRITGLAPDTLRNYASICGRIAINVRRAELPFGTHEPVASLDVEDQRVWLQEAVDNGWGKQELRDAIRDAKTGNGGGGSGSDAELDSGDSRVPIGERIEEAARLILTRAQNNSDGDWVVPDSAMAQLRAALGEE